MSRDLLPLLEASFAPAAPRYKGVQVESFYRLMSDGVRVAIDVLLPLNRAASDRLPTVMVMTRYWRSFAMMIPSPPKSAPISANMELWNTLIERGIAVVAVDGRGSGASFGAHPHPWSARELADYGEVAEWVSEQAWSNGKVGASGFSYEGSTAQYLPASAPKIVPAILSQQTELDPFADVALPGGIFNEAFISAWSESNHRQDNNKPAVFFPFLVKLFSKGVRRVDADKDGALLKQAIADHAGNPPVYAAMDSITYRDDPYLPGVTVDDFAVFKRQKDIEASGAVLFNWGSWMDGRTAETALSRFNTFSNPQVVVITASSHDGSQNGDPYANGAKPSPTPAQNREIQARYFQTFLGEKSAPAPRKRVIYYVMGLGQWRETEVWPPAHVTPQRWQIGVGRVLTQAAPTQTGHDDYTVDFSATTGKNNRWHTELVKPVKYGNRAAQDAKLLTYTGAPLTSDLEITGHPLIEIMLKSTHPDGALYVYLESLDSNGIVRYLSDGQVRLIHRQTSDDSPYWVGGVYRTYRRADAAPFPVGQFVPVRLSLHPLSVVVPRGSRLRIAIAGHDDQTFRRIPSDGVPTLSVAWDGTWVELPVNP